MNWEELAEKVTKNYDPGRKTLNIQQSDFGTVPALSMLFDAMGMRNVLLVNVAPWKRNGQSIVARGRIREVPGLNDDDEVSAAAVFSFVDGAPRMVFAFGAPDPADRRWTFTDSFPQLADTALSAIEAAKDARFVYASVDHVDHLLDDGKDVTLKRGLNFHGGIQFKGKIFDKLGSIAGGFTRMTVSGPIEVNSFGPTFHLALEPDAGINDLFAKIRLPSPALSMDSEFFADGTHSAGLRFSTKFSIGGGRDLKLEPMLTDDSGAVTFKATFDNLAFPGLATLAGGFGSELGGLEALLPPELTGGLLRSVEISLGPGKRVGAVGFTIRSASGDGELPLVPQLKLKSVDRTLKIKDPADSAKRKAELAVAGTIAIGALPLKASAAYPKQVVEAGLADGTTFDPKVVIGAFFPAFADVLPQFKKLNLRVDMKAQPHHYWITAEAADGASAQKSWDFGGTSPVRLTALKLNLTNGRKTNGQVDNPAAQIEGQPPGQVEGQAPDAARDPSNGWPEGVKPGALAGVITGSLDLFHHPLNGVWDIGNEFRINAQLPDVNIDLKDFVKRLFGELDSLGVSVPLFPTWLPAFQFRHTAICIAHKAGDAASDVLMLRTTLDGGPVLAFEALKTSGTWGFVAAVDLGGGGLSKIPGLSGIDDFVHLDDMMVLISSTALSSYSFPDASRFDNPALDAPVPEKLKQAIRLPSQTDGKLTPGVAIHARWVLDRKQKVQKFFCDLLGLHSAGAGEVAFNVTLEIGRDPMQHSKLFVSYAIGILGMPVVSSQLGVLIENRTPALFASGQLTVTIQGHPVQFDMMLMVVPNGALIYGDMIGSVTIPFIGLTLSDLVLVLGVSYELAPTFGFACQLDTSNFHSSLAFLENSTDPQASVLAGSVSDLSLKDVVSTIAHASPPSDLGDILDKVSLSHTLEFTIAAVLANDLDSRRIKPVADAFNANTDFTSHPGFIAGTASLPDDISDVHLVIVTKGQTWAIADLKHQMRRFQLDKDGEHIRVRLNPQLYCVPKEATIGPLHFDEGFSLHAKMEVFAIKGVLDVEISTSSGIAAEGTLDRIVLDVGSVRLFGITSADGSKGPRLSLATFARPGFSDLAHPDWDELKKAHFLLDGKITLLDVSQSTKITVNAGGFDFAIEDQVSSVAKLTLTGTFKPARDPRDSVLDASGSFRFDLGSVPVPGFGSYDIASFSAGLSIGYRGSVNARLDSTTFAFLGTRLDIPGFGISIDVPLADLGDKVKDNVIDAIKDYLNPLKQLGKIIGDIADEVGKIHIDEHGVSYSTHKNPEPPRNDANWVRANRTWPKDLAMGPPANWPPSAALLAALLEKQLHVSAADVIRPLRDGGCPPDEIVVALATVFKLPARQAAQLLKSAGYEPGPITEPLRVHYLLDATSLAKVLWETGYDTIGFVPQIISSMRAVQGWDALTVLRAVRKAGYLDGHILVAARSLARSPDDTMDVLKKGGYAADQVVRAVQAAFNLSPDLVVGMLERAGYLNGDVDTVLAQKGLGYLGLDIASELASNFKRSHGAITKLLKQGGFEARAIVGIFHTDRASKHPVFGEDDGGIASLLKDAGFGIADIVDALRATAGTPATMGRLLLMAGYEPADVASKTLGYSARELAVLLIQFPMTQGPVLTEVAKLLGRAGFDTAEIAGVFRAETAAAPLFAMSLVQTMALLREAGFGRSALSALVGTPDSFPAVAASLAVQLRLTDGQRLFAMLADYGYDRVTIDQWVIKPETRRAVATAAKGAGYTAGEVLALLDDFFRPAGILDPAARAQDLRSAYTAQEVATAFGKSPTETAKLLKGAGYDIAQVAGAFPYVSAVNVASLLRSAGFGALEVAKRWPGKSAVETAQLLKDAGFAAPEVADQALGYSAAEMAKQLEAVFGQSAIEVVKLLKHAGFDVFELAKIWPEKTTAEIMQLLAGAGFAASAVADIGRFAPERVEHVRVLRGSGVTARDAAHDQHVRALNLQDAARLLKQAGYEPRAIYAMIQYEMSHTNRGKRAAGNIVAFMRQANFNAQETGEAVSQHDDEPWRRSLVQQQLKNAGFSDVEIAGVNWGRIRTL